MSSWSAKGAAVRTVTSSDISSKFRALEDEGQPEDAPRVDNLRHKMKAIWRMANSYASGTFSGAEAGRPKEHPPIFVGEDASGKIYAYVVCFGPDGSEFSKENQLGKVKLIFAARGIKTFVFACEAFVSEVEMSVSDFEKGKYLRPSKAPNRREALVLVAVDGTEKDAKIELSATASLIVEPRQYARMVFSPRATVLSGGLSSLVTYGFDPAPKDIAEDIERALDMVPTITSPHDRDGVGGHG